MRQARSSRDSIGRENIIRRMETGLLMGRVEIAQDEYPDDPEVVWFCGSTRFMETFAKVNCESLAGKIVLSVGAIGT